MKKQKITYVGLVTRSGDHVLVDLHAGIVEQFFDGAWQEIESSWGTIEERVFGDANELIAPTVLLRGEGHGDS